MKQRHYSLKWLDEQFPEPGAQSKDEVILQARSALTTVASVFLEISKTGDLSLFESILKDVRQHQLTERSCCDELAAAAAVSAGKMGVEMLAHLAASSDAKSGIQVAINTLWLAAQHKSLPLPTGYAGLVAEIEFPINSATRLYAKQALDDLVLTSKEKPQTFSAIMSIASIDAIANQVHGGRNEFFEYIMQTLMNRSISFSSTLFDEFEELLERDLREEEYQAFLQNSPAILDPLAAKVIPKQKLGLEHITDFVIRRHDNRYLVVEIEKPQDRIFTAGNDFSAPFTHAVGQILDFQSWISENVDYAKRIIGNVENPRGLLVMGRRRTLTSFQERKLHRWQINSNHIEVVTYDDLLISGRQLLSSLSTYVGDEP